MLVNHPLDESARQAALDCLCLVDTPPDPGIDQITALAARIFRVPVAVVSIADQDRLWFKSAHGVSVREIPRDRAFCDHVVRSNGLLAVSDASRDERFADNVLVTGPMHLRFYAGAPLVTRLGAVLGTLCLIDQQPRDFSPAEAEMLARLAAMVVTLVEAGAVEQDLRREIRAHEQTVQTLGQAEAKYRNIAAHSPGMVHQFVRRRDGSGAFLFISDACREILEIEPEELRRDAGNYFRLFDPQDLPGYRQAAAEALAEMKTLQWEGRFRTPSGRTKWLHLTSQPERLPNGDVLWDGILLDQTARRHADSRLRMLESSVEHANDAVLITEAEPVTEPGPRILYVNKAFTAMTGYGPEEVIGKTPRLLHGPGTDPEVNETIRRALKRWRPVQVELLNHRKDGTSFWVELNIVPVADERGWFTHWVSVQRDITERKRAQAHSAEQMRLAAMGAEVGLALAGDAPLKEALHRCAEAMVRGTGAAFARVWTLNADDDVLELQASAGLYTRLDGPHSRVPVGSLKIGLIARERRPHLTNQVIGDPRVSNQQWARENGMVAFAGYPLIVEDRVIGVVALFSRTALSQETFQAVDAIANALALGIGRRRAEEATRAAKNEAERANLAKSEFLSRVSHEFRTPLNSIIGFGQLLELEIGDERQRDSLAYILKGGRHLLSLIDEVLDISRIESGNLELEPVPISVASVFDEAAALIQVLATQRGVRLERAIAGTAAKEMVLADFQRLKQVLLNLLSNAVKYNRPQGGTVHMGCSPSPEQPGWLRLSVRDTGPGIAPENLGRLFMPFERLDAAHSDVEGTGIGLALSKRLVEAMDGRIGVESVPGEGSTFYVDLPHYRPDIDPEEDEPATPPSSEEVHTSEATVLYIEDHLPNLFLVEQLLQSTRPAVRLSHALEGARGLEMAAARPPDAILLDLHLPDVSGCEVLQRLRADERTRHVPVLVVSADSTPERIERLTALGASGYLTKPFNIRTFLQAFDGVLAETARV